MTAGIERGSTSSIIFTAFCRRSPVHNGPNGALIAGRAGRVPGFAFPGRRIGRVPCGAESPVDVTDARPALSEPSRTTGVGEPVLVRVYWKPTSLIARPASRLRACAARRGGGNRALREKRKLVACEPRHGT
jgi:hypothetical protein